MSVEKKSFEAGIVCEKERILNIIAEMVSKTDQTNLEYNKIRRKTLEEVITNLVSN